jgi:hypothetical protein
MPLQATRRHFIPLFPYDNLRDWSVLPDLDEQCKLQCGIPFHSRPASSIPFQDMRFFVLKQS